MSKNVLVLVLGFFFLNTTLCQAQLGNMVPKSNLLNTLGDVSDLGFSDNDKSALSSQNESFVNDIYSIVDGNQSEEDKKIALKNLKKQNDDKLLGLLGEDGTRKYKKKMKKAMRPYTRRVKLLGLVL